jgi:cellulose synthase/poly-beta-1,6-N-acetylglucosamine synthase-like glycosyltransferase
MAAGFDLADSIFTPSVAVIVPIYNGEADLIDLLTHLQQQTYPVAQVEYWLVDNNSSDGTAALLADWTRRFSQFHTVLEADIQSSYAARNRGIRAAHPHCEILVFTDADCRPEPDWLAHLVQPFADPQVGLVAGAILALPGHTILERFAEHHGILSQVYTLKHAFLPYGQTANLAVRRSILETVGLFRPHLTTGGDADLCWRILQNSSWQIQLAEKAVVRHRHRSTLKEFRSQWQRYGQSSRYLHELHGTELTAPLTGPEQRYRWKRWFLKELPGAVIKNPERSSVSRRIDAMVDTPLDLIRRQAHAQGQQAAQLPSNAREIDWLSPSCRTATSSTPRSS